VFYKDESGAVFHCYSCYDRGNDKLNILYHDLHRVPKAEMRVAVDPSGCAGMMNTADNGYQDLAIVMSTVLASHKRSATNCGPESARLARFWGDYTKAILRAGRWSSGWV